jgi:putative PIN family toxin of toxin-antitoxin system
VVKVFFDASVIIAAMLSPAGGSAYLLDTARKSLLVAITSQTVIDEVKSKTAKIKRSDNEINSFIMEKGILVRHRITAKEIENYERRIALHDAHLIAGAKLTKCNFLVSLDKKHVLKQQTKRRFLPLKTVSPAELIANLRRSFTP